jgi:hypothetical protein
MNKRRDTMALPTGYGSNVRQSLVDKGVGNNDIGYNKSNGYITVKGQDFMKPSKVLDGVSYDTLSNFNNAWNNYSKSQQSPVNVGTPSYNASSYVPNGMISTREGLNNFGISSDSIGYQNGNTTVNGNYFGTPSLNLGGTTYYTPQGMNNAMTNYRINDIRNQVSQNLKLPENPYTQQINDQLQALMQMAQNQQQVDPYSTAQYAAYKAQADRNAQQGIRAAQEAMGTSGFGRSTMLGERAQGIQNDANEYLETQVIPQIIASEQARQQQQYANMSSLLEPLMNQQGYADNRHLLELQNLYNQYGLESKEQQRGLDNARADAALTGNYLTPDQQSAITTLLGLKQQAEKKGITKDQRAALSAQADNVRNQMKMLGLDPTKYGANVGYDVASQNMPGRTIQGQQLDLNKQQQEFNQSQQNWQNQYQMEEFAYKKARDAIADQQWQAKFDQDVRQFGLDYGLRKLQTENDQAYRQATLAINQDDNARAWLTYDDKLNQTPAAKYNGMNANQVYSALESRFSVKDEDTEKSYIPNDAGTKQKIYEQVMSSGLPDGQDTQVMTMLGLSAKDIANFDKQYGVSSGN